MEKMYDDANRPSDEELKEMKNKLLKELDKCFSLDLNN